MTKSLYTNRTALTTCSALLTRLMNDAVEGYVPDECGELIEKLGKMVDALDKRTQSKGTHAPTAKQMENEGYKEQVMALLANGDMTIPQLIESIGDAITSQRMSALLTQLKKEGKVERLPGKTAVFTLCKVGE